jgi:nucleotide-binding universal stress UspA family protein
MIQKILVVVDDRAATESAIDQAIELAQTHRADLFFFSVTPPIEVAVGDMVSVPDPTLSAAHAAQASRRLAEASAWAERCGVHSHRARSNAQDPAQAVADAAKKRHCDMIVVATEEQNAVVRLLSGSIVPGLISRASVPVLVCRQRPLHTKRRGYPKVSIASQHGPYERGTRADGESND